MTEQNVNQELNTKEEVKNNDWIYGYLILGAATFIGYKVGYRRCSRLQAKGLSKVFKVDPELEGRMWDAIKKISMNE